MYLSPPSTLPPGSAVWAYLRDSGGPSQGESIDRQRSEIEAYCRQNGLRLAHVFQDAARSGGSTTGRDDFDELIRRSADPDPPAGLLVWDFARLSRSLDDSGYYKAVLRKNGLVIHSLTDAIPEGPYSRMVEVVIDIANEEKRRQVSRDTASGLRHIVDLYDAMPGTPPAGYMRSPVHVGTRRDGSAHILHRWVPDPEKAPLVLRAFQMRAEGATYRQIRKATGLFQSKNSYPTFFNNTIYKGERWYSGRTYPCDPIITPELWDAVQRMGQLRSRERYGLQHPRRLSSRYLLSGLAICQECGSPMLGYKIMGQRLYYVCGRSRRRMDCGGRHVPARQIETAVIAKIQDDILTLENMLRVQSVQREVWNSLWAQKEQSAASRTRALSLVRKRITRLTEAIGISGQTRALLEALRNAEAERDALEIELEQLALNQPEPELPAAAMAEIAASINTRLNGEDEQTRKQAIREVVQRVLIRREGNRAIAVIEYQLPKTKHPP
jgi:DNA invertase Pin-like site-specific DNA recombinase